MPETMLGTLHDLTHIINLSCLFYNWGILSVREVKDLWENKGCDLSQVCLYKSIYTQTTKVMAQSIGGSILCSTPGVLGQLKDPETKWLILYVMDSI